MYGSFKSGILLKFLKLQFVGFALNWLAYSLKSKTFYQFLIIDKDLTSMPVS